MLKKHLDDLKCALKHYSKRFRRIFREPQPGHEESWIYKKIRTAGWAEEGSKLSFISTLFAIIVVFSLVCLSVYGAISETSRYMKFSYFEEFYTLGEYIFQVCILPPMVYLIIILFFAHVVALIFKRVFDFSGYSLAWIAKRYIKVLGDATVIAIICGVVSFAVFVSGENYKASFSLADYMSFFAFSFSIVFSFVFFVKIFVEMRKFFEYPIMGIIFPAGCFAVSWIFFDVILSGSMLNSVAKAVTGSYIDPLLVRMQKLFDATPSDMSVIRKNFSDNPLLWLGSSSPEYSVVLGQMKIVLLCFAVVIFVFFWVRDRKRNPTDESRDSSLEYRK
ncbi:hypothetical protein [Rothia mucilaginosa]|uniref:hypothetical protein n=1 Tax=Rothia mucilaginosa TaxID=43675 RepID=UPI0025F0D7AB|nr:hypothetical protein [Rothia mucilaginosa]